MTTFWRWILAASIACGVAQSVAAQSPLPLPERVARLPDTNFRAWFGTMLEMEYQKGAAWQSFFGDVGPTEGCAAIQDIKKRILQRDLHEFKAAYVDAVSRGMAPTVFSNVPDNLLSTQFSSLVGRFQKDLSVFLGPRVLEMGEAGRQWADSHGYRGRRLGYNNAGIPYWGSQSALTNLVCLFPGDGGLLRGWKD